MKQRWLALVMCCAMLFSCMGGVSATGELIPQYQRQGDFEYYVTDNGATVSQYTGESYAVTVPAKLGGYPVTAIGDHAFEEAGFFEISMPDSITHIGDYAFYGCTELASLYIPLNASHIGASAFEGCTGLQTVYMWEMLTDVGGRAFYGCTGLMSNEMIVVNSVLYEYRGVNTWVELPGNITRIGADAFRNNDTLVDIILPASVTHIDAGAFFNCSKLKDLWFCGNKELQAGITIAENNPSLDAAIWHNNTCSYFQHIFSGLCDAICNKCEWTRPAGEHAYDDDEDMICNNCTTSRTPPQPIVQSFGIHHVALQAFEGCEYSAGGGVWQDSSIFEGLSPNTTYVFYQRVKKTNQSDQSAISIGLTITTVAVPALGDVDASGSINSSDARLTLQYFNKKIPEGGIYLPTSDVDGDGETTSTDARLILQYAAGKIDKFPVQ